MKNKLTAMMNPMRMKLACLATFAMAMTAAHLTAQVFTTLHSFTAIPYRTETNSDGARPDSLILSGNTLYGTAESGGNGAGTVFRVNTAGTGFTNLYSFTGGSDGAIPGGLLLSGNTLYGTAEYGGTSDTDSGTVFAVTTDGSGFTNLHSFTALDAATGTINSDGANPQAGLILSGNTLYGTAVYGGSSGNGTVFALNTDGTRFTNLYTFTEGQMNYQYNTITNSDGAYPTAGLILSGNTLYGTASSGGSSGFGTVFRINTDGTGFTTLHSFTASPYGTNSDGAYPDAGLILSGNTLYGTARECGSSGSGTVFALNTDGTGFTTLHSFTGGKDGSGPKGLILSGNTLYGTTDGGGSMSGTTANWESGTVFAVKTDGTDFTTLNYFPSIGFIMGIIYGSEGGNPHGLVLSGNTLYGMADTGADTSGLGGSLGSGLVFSLSFPPQLALIPSSPYVILTWPTNYAGFDYSGFTLQSTTNLGSSAVWTTNSSPPVVIGGENVVINTTTSGKQQFYRLSQGLP
jgi:uncharacterized repeat protein (TIGR03803 family)